MKKIPLLIALTFQMTSMYGQATDRSADAFFAAPKTPPPDLSFDRAYPQGREFPFAFLSVGGGMETDFMGIYPDEVINELIQEYKEAGFNMMAPRYELDYRNIEDAEKHDLMLIHSVGIKMNFKSDTPLKMTPEEVKEVIGKEVREAADCELIQWWNVEPEELRFWMKNEMEYLQAVTEAIRENDPLNRPIWMYQATHFTGEAMAKAGKYLDVIGKGNYTNLIRKKDERVFGRWTMEEELKAEEILGRDMVTISVLEMFMDPDQEDWELINDWVVHDVFISVATGAEGFVIYSLRKRPNFAAHKDYYDAYKKIGPMFLGPDGLGQVYLYGEERDDISVNVIMGPSEVEMSPYAGAGLSKPTTFESVTVSNLAYGDKRYLTLVNSANEPVQLVVSNIPYMAVRADNLLDDADSFWISEGEFMVTLPPLGVAVYEMWRSDS